MKNLRDLVNLASLEGLADLADLADLVGLGRTRGLALLVLQALRVLGSSERSWVLACRKGRCGRWCCVVDVR